MPRRRIALGVLLVALAAAIVVGAPRLSRAMRRDRAERAYVAGAFREAHDAFHELSLELSQLHRPLELPAIEYDAANAAYRMGRFAEAVTGFRTGLLGGPALQEKSSYNLGNSYVWLSRAENDKRGTLRAAVNAYEDALLLDPTDVDAKLNLEIAVERLEAEEERLGGGPHRDANWGGGNLTKSGYAGTPQTAAGATPGGGFGGTGGEQVAERISESQARRLLKELERGELSGQDVRQMNRDRRPVRRRDW